ncbi:MAG: hypothetical protein ACK55I_16415, partial [bacterium]
CILRSSWVEAQAILDEAYELARVRQQLEESDSQADVDLAECCDRFALVAYARGRHRDAVQFHGRSASLYDLALKKSTHAAAFLPDVVASRLLAAATLLALRRKTDLQRLLG